MKFLLEIPLVVSLAEWVWNCSAEDATSNKGDHDDVSSEICLSSFPLMTAGCWRQLSVKGVGVAIILAACLNKAPVIRNIVQSKSISGLSAGSVYGETLMYANSAYYSLLSGFPFTAYGENAVLLIQSVAIVMMLWQYADVPVSFKQRTVAATMGACYTVGCLVILPKQYCYLLMTSIVPILLFSRGSQIVETFRCQHTGAQSILTTTMNLVGGLIRILTTIQEVGWDMAVLRTFFLSFLLNVIMFLQYFYYRANTDKFLANVKVQSQTKKES
jgi:mannose-P-dolichol utilization defect 1